MRELLEVDFESGSSITPYIDPFIREAGRDSGAFFFCFRQEDGKLVDGGHGNVAAVVAGQKGLHKRVSLPVFSRESVWSPYLALKVEKEYGRCHVWRLFRRLLLQLEHASTR